MKSILFTLLSLSVMACSSGALSVGADAKDGSTSTSTNTNDAAAPATSDGGTTATGACTAKGGTCVPQGVFLACYAESKDGCDNGDRCCLPLPEEPPDAALAPSCGGDAGGGCGPSTCGACPTGTRPNDVCQNGTWSCQCVPVGAACETDSQCPTGEACGFEDTFTCGAQAAGHCFPRTGPLCNCFVPGCACDGTTINVACTQLPPGVSPKALAKSGACP